MTKVLPLAVGAAILTIGLAAALSSRRPIPAPVTINQVNNTMGTLSLSLSAPLPYQQSGTNVDLTLTAETGATRVTAVQVELTYDPAKLSVTSVTPGTFFPNVLSAAKIQSGKINFTYAASPDSGGVSGSGSVATIRVKPLSSGSTKLTFTSTTQAAGIGASGNVLKSASDLTLTTRLPADLNADGAVNLFDYNQLVADFGRTTPGLAADIDRDNDVDIYDYNLLVSSYGQTS